MAYSDKYFDNVSGNEFLNPLYELYEALNFPDEKDFEMRKVKYINRIGIARYHKVKVNTKAEKLYKKFDELIEQVRTTPSTFDRLFDFASFVRSMETVFFYKNEESATICCDHDINQERKRRIFFNMNDFTIRIYLERDIDSMNNEMVINIYRNYGKKLFNEFHVKNRDTVYDTADDLYLINNVNKIVQTEMANFLRRWEIEIMNDGSVVY